jgi:hypothetical protein
MEMSKPSWHGSALWQDPLWDDGKMIEVPKVLSGWLPIGDLHYTHKDGRHILLKVPTYPQFDISIEHDQAGTLSTIRPCVILLCRYSTWDRHWKIVPDGGLVSAPAFDEPTHFCEVPNGE